MNYQKTKTLLFMTITTIFLTGATNLTNFFSEFKNTAETTVVSSIAKSIDPIEEDLNNTGLNLKIQGLILIFFITIFIGMLSLFTPILYPLFPLAMATIYGHGQSLYDKIITIIATIFGVGMGASLFSQPSLIQKGFFITSVTGLLFLYIAGSLLGLYTLPLFSSRKNQAHPYLEILSAFFLGIISGVILTYVSPPMLTQFFYKLKSTHGVFRGVLTSMMTLGACLVSFTIQLIFTHIQDSSSPRSWSNDFITISGFYFILLTVLLIKPLIKKWQLLLLYGIAGIIVGITLWILTKIEELSLHIIMYNKKTDPIKPANAENLFSLQFFSPRIFLKKIAALIIFLSGAYMILDAYINANSLSIRKLAVRLLRKL